MESGLVYQGNVTDQGILKFFGGEMGIENVKKTMLQRTDILLEEVPFDS